MRQKESSAGAAGGAIESLQKVGHDMSLLAFAVILAAFLTIMHRTNIARLINGTEQFFTGIEIDC